MVLLKHFAVLTLAAGMILSLIPEGSLRRTASMAAGLLMLLFWADGISVLISEAMNVTLSAPPPGPLTSTGSTVSQAAASAAETLQQLWEGNP